MNAEINEQQADWLASQCGKIVTAVDLASAPDRTEIFNPNKCQCFPGNSPSDCCEECPR